MSSTHPTPQASQLDPPQELHAPSGSSAPNVSHDPAPAAAAAAAARADARALRIAAAVERSRTEYQPSHAFTEPAWFMTQSETVEDTTAGPRSRYRVSKPETQRVEYATTYRLVKRTSEASAQETEVAGVGTEEAAAAAAVSEAEATEKANTRRAVADASTGASVALAEILALVQPTKPLLGLSRELLSTAMAAAIRAGDMSAGVMLACGVRSAWRTNVGLAVECSDVLAWAGHVSEATHPLLAITALAIHHPILTRLYGLLSGLPEPAPTLGRVIQTLAKGREWAFTRPLFEARTGSTSGASGVAGVGVGMTMDEARTTVASIDVEHLAHVLGADVPVLRAVLTKVTKAVGGGGATAEEDEEGPEGQTGERVERGVREL